MSVIIIEIFPEAKRQVKIEVKEVVGMREPLISLERCPDLADSFVARDHQEV